MPRILPRLIKRLAEHPLSELVYTGPGIKRKTKPSLYRPLPQNVPFNPNRSILLEPINPITHESRYRLHKRMPPSLRLKRTTGGTKTDPTREMNEEEKEWWSNPYLRMLASPIRRCAHSDRHLPTDFLIRLGVMQIPTNLRGEKSSKGKTSMLVPDGLEHPKYTHRKCGEAVYILCWRQAIELCIEGSKDLYARSRTPPRLLEHIGHVLRVRVLQELELLADEIASYFLSRRHATPTPILRRLTREEFQCVRETGIVPYPNALAILVVPPVNRDPETKERAQASMSPLPIPDTPVERKRPDLPMFTSLSASSSEEQIPLYNAASLFPLREQRAALHSILLRILGSEQNARKLTHKRQETEGDKKERRKGDQKGSHAFLLCSNGESIRRGDSAATAIALWRLRLFEGGDWEEEETQDKWLLTQKYRSLDKFE